MIDYTFGSKSIFPTVPLNVNAVNEQAIGLLNFDLGSYWSDGQALLYNFISQQNADVPAANNWVNANVCGVDIPIIGPGAQRLPLPFANGAYQPCAIALTDKNSFSIAFNITPELKQVMDNYTGATVQVWGLPIGQNFSGTPPTTSNLSANDLQNCKSNSSVFLYGLCNNITLSAVWAVDPLARDVVYMGLDPKDMPRLNLNLPAAAQLNPEQVLWPNNATITAKLQNDGTVLITWPAAVVASAKQPPLKYLLYVWDGANWIPQSCNQDETQCSLKSAPPASQTANIYVIAINDTVSPPSQTPQLFGCYPTANSCQQVTTGKPTKTHHHKR